MNQSAIALKAFNGIGFKPYGILIFLQIELGGKEIWVEIEFIDTMLDCNVIMGHNLVYGMVFVISTYFIMMYFPH